MNDDFTEKRAEREREKARQRWWTRATAYANGNPDPDGPRCSVCCEPDPTHHDWCQEDKP